MKKPNKFFRKAACFCLVICMVLAMFPAAFADEAAPTELTPEQQAQEAERIRKKKLLEEELARQAAEAAAAQASAEAQAAQQAAAEANAQADQTGVEAQAGAVNQEPAVTETPAANDTAAETQSAAAGEESVADAANSADGESAEKPVDGESAGENAVVEETVGEEAADENTPENSADASANGESEEAVEQSGDEEAADENAPENTADASADEESNDAVEQSEGEEAAGENAVAEESSEDGASEDPAADGSDNTESTEEGTVQTTEATTLFGLTALATGAANTVEDDFDSTLAESNALGSDTSTLSSSPTAATGIWKAAGKFFNTVKEAIESIFSDPEATDATVELTQDYEGDEGIDIKVDTGKNVVIDLCKKTFKVISDIAAKITGNGSVTIKNGEIASDNGSAVQTDVAELEIKNTTLVGSSADGTLDINGGDVDITGKTTIDSGKSTNTAIDISGDSDVDVSTTGIVLGKVNANGDEVEAELHNGYYNGEITAESGAEVEVDGGNYTNNVSKYVSGKTNYAEIRTPNGAIYSAGNNIPETAFVSSRFAPTAVNILKSSGAVILPAGVAAINSTGKVIFVNGRPVFCGQTVFIHGCGCRCSTASIVDGANSVWYKGAEDGLTIELSSAVSYVTIDNVKANAVIDGVYAELGADTLESLSAGSHTVRFVLKNGSVAVTTVKVAPDEKIEWASDSENGLEYEMSANVKKVLIDHVKVAAEISGKNVSIPASILQDLKTGNHTVEFVLENTSHVVTSITVK